MDMANSNPIIEKLKAGDIFSSWKLAMKAVLGPFAPLVVKLKVTSFH